MSDRLTEAVDVVERTLMLNITTGQDRTPRQVAERVVGYLDRAGLLGVSQTRDSSTTAQDRVAMAGSNWQTSAHHQPPTQAGYAALALVDVVRQIGIEMLEPVTEDYEVLAEESDQTLYRGGNGD